MQNSITALVGIHGALEASLPEDTKYSHVNVRLQSAYGHDLTFVVWEDDEAITAAYRLADALEQCAHRAAANLAKRRDEARKAELERESAARKNLPTPSDAVLSIPTDDGV